MKIATVALAVLALSLAACGADEPPPPKAAAAQPLPNSNVFSTDVKALNKAKNVQNVVNDQQKAQGKVLQDQGG